MYIYICVCVCDCVCPLLQHVMTNPIPLLHVTCWLQRAQLLVDRPHVCVLSGRPQGQLPRSNWLSVDKC